MELFLLCSLRGFEVNGRFSIRVLCKAGDPACQIISACLTLARPGGEGNPAMAAGQTQLFGFSQDRETLDFNRDHGLVQRQTMPLW